MSLFLKKTSQPTKKEADKVEKTVSIKPEESPNIEKKEKKKESIKKEEKKEEQPIIVETSIEKTEPKKHHKETAIIPKELETKIESIESFVQSVKDGKFTNIIVNGNQQEVASLRQKVETLTAQLTELRKDFDSRPVRVITNDINANIKSPSVIRNELLNKYKLPVSITYEELLKLTDKDVPDRDDLKFLTRFKKNNADFELLYAEQTK